MKDKEWDQIINRDVEEWKKRNSVKERMSKNIESRKKSSNPHRKRDIKIVPKLPPVPVTLAVHYSIGDWDPDGIKPKEVQNKEVMGWICPICKRGVSPKVQFCDCFKIQENENVNIA